MKEQDQDLESLEKTVMSTKHIALAVNEELNLHTRLLVIYVHLIILTRNIIVIITIGTVIILIIIIIICCYCSAIFIFT